MYPQDFLFIFHGFLCVLVYGSSISHTRRGLGAGVTQVIDFDCPEEFGYYPHPNDCTQYYVCVFGGALLESCTGGLMYSHELQTCDWPRNVGCGESGGSDGGTVSTVRVTDPRTRNPTQSRPSTSAQHSPAQAQPTRSSHRQEYNRPHQEEVVQQQLYTEEDLGPAEEIESDRQQRVYRGQPSSIGQVQRDRDGLRTLKSGVHSQNVIPTGPGAQEKISVVSFGSQRQSAPRPQEQYRTAHLQTAQIPLVFLSGANDAHFRSYISPYGAIAALPRPHPPHPYSHNIRDDKLHLLHPIYDYYQPRQVAASRRPLAHALANNSRDNSHLLRLTHSTIQSDFRPIRYIEAAINPSGAPVRTLSKPLVTFSATTVRPKIPAGSKHGLFSFGGLVRVATGRPRKNSSHRPDDRRNSYGPTGTITASTTEKYAGVRTTPKPPFALVEKPKDYDLRWFHAAPSHPRGNDSTEVGIIKHHRYVQFVQPQEYDYEERHAEEEKDVPEKKDAADRSKQAEDLPTQNEKPLTVAEAMPKSNVSFFDFIDVLGFRDAEEVKAAIRAKMPGETTTVDASDEKFHVPEHGANPRKEWNHLARHQTTTERPRYDADQIEAPRQRIPEGYYDNFKPLPTKSPYMTKRPDADTDADEDDDDDDDDGDGFDIRQQILSGSRVEQVQGHQLTSALPPLTATSRPVERYNTSQRFQPNQFDQYYTVYDDGVEIYRSNDYSQQYQSPSSTPSSNIVNQYRGQTTYKQSLEEHAPEPVQQQQHRNTYSQDLYSPPPVLQDYNDQYSVQIDDQQYQQFGQPTPKPASRSESANSSKDALTDSSGISVTLLPENVTTKPDASPIIRRSDSNSYFSISSFGPSTVLLPPLKLPDATFPPPKATPARQTGTADAEPPKNAGALAKTFNSFDNLLSSFLAAVTNARPALASALTPTPPPAPPKTAPETIVRSEIGRIHHDPIVIADDFKIRQPPFENPQTPDGSDDLQILSLPPPSSTPAPPKLTPDDYLAYFVEIEPKKPKKEEQRRGFVLAAPQRVPETTAEPKTVTRDDLGLGLAKPRPFTSFVRIVPTAHTQNVQLGTALDLEPVAQQQQKKKSTGPRENDTIEKQKPAAPIATVARRPPFQAVGKWVIAKNERPRQPAGFQPTPEPGPSDAYSRDPPKQRPAHGAKPRPTQGQRQKDVETMPGGGGGGDDDNPLSEPETTVVTSPYQFLLIDLDASTEPLSTPMPFTRNPENEDRNRFPYKTNPETRVRSRYLDHGTSPRGEPKAQAPLAHRLAHVPAESTAPHPDAHSTINFTYKTNPQTRLTNRFIPTGDAVGLRGSPHHPPDTTTSGDTLPQTEPASNPTTASQRPPSPPPKKPDSTNPPPHPPPPDSTKQRSSTPPPELTTPAQQPRKPPRTPPNTHRNDAEQTLSPPLLLLQHLRDNALAKENDIHPVSTYRPIVVPDGLDALNNKTRFRFTVEDERDFAYAPDNKIPPPPLIDAVPRGFQRHRPTAPADADLGDTSASHKGPQALPKRPRPLKNLTLFENRATTKGFRGKFKADGSKPRLRPATASADSESTPGPHLSTRQPGGHSVGTTGNELAINRGTPSPNRGTRPTLKPSTAIVSKASDFVDIYRYPPRRPQNLYATPTPDKSAAKCRKDVCLLPDCSCGGKDIPAGYSAQDIPQLVLLTFDDSVNDLNKGLYADLFERGRLNPNGCPISATFYVSHEWTDYSQVQNLYASGHEIASHSITHSFGEQFSQKKWTKEIAGQREILAAYGGVRLEDIRGMRAPFLAVGGNKMFKMLYDSNFTYDSSMPIYENRPPSWPYTLDYKLFHDCMIPPCPTKSYPGVWEVPMVMWQDLNGGRCSMGDACSNPPTADGVYKMLIKNFERHFTTNRAPFGLYYHAAWFTHEHHKEGFLAFLDTIVNMPEVWLVTTWQAIEWVRDPQPLSTVNDFPPFRCNVEKAKKCNNPKVCNLWHKSGVRYMRTCQPCPDVYPWTGKTGVKNSRVDNEVIEE